MEVLNIPEIKAFTKHERLQAVHDLWDSLVVCGDDLPISGDFFQGVLDRCFRRTSMLVSLIVYMWRILSVPIG